MSDRTCSIDGCGNAIASRGWCSGHYKRWSTFGDPLLGTPPKQHTAPCRIADCDRPVFVIKTGLCRLHTKRLRLHGDPLTVLTDGYPTVCTIDGCAKKVLARGWCSTHYDRWHKTGTPNKHTATQRTNAKYRARERPGFKVCRRCDVLQRVERFRMRKVGPQAGTRITHCDDCRRAYNAENRDRKAAYNARRHFGLSDARYAELMADPRCHACGTTATQSHDGGLTVRRHHIDHDHRCCPGSTSCGRCVRGLLCHWCNTALGLLDDDPARIRALLAYLRRTDGKGGDTAPVAPKRRVRAQRGRTGGHQQLQLGLLPPG